MLPNFQRLTVAVLAMFAVAAGVHGVHWLQAGSRTDYMQRNLSRARETGDPKELIAALKRYLAMHPGDSERRSELLELLAEHARAFDDILDVYYRYQEFLRAHPEDAVHRERMIGLAVRLNEHQDVLSNLEFLSAKMELTPKLLMWKAGAQHKTGDIEGTIRSYQAVIELDPAQIEAYVELATLMRRNQDAPENAQYWIRKLTEANPKSSSAFLAQSRYYLETEELDAALVAVEESLKHPGSQTEGVLLWSEVVMTARQRESKYDDLGWEQRDEEIARKLEDAWQTDRAEPRFASKLAALALRKNQPDEAERLLKEGLEHAPANPLLLWELADLMISRDRLDDARRFVAELTAVRVTAGLVDYLRGRMLLREQQWYEAANCFLRARGDVAPSPRLSAQADIYLSTCYAQLGDNDQRLTVARRAVETQPFFVATRQQLAQSLLAVGRVDEALAEYRTMLELPDAPAYGWTADVGWAAVAKVLIIRNLSIPESERSWEDLNPVLEALKAAAPDSIEVTLLRAEVLASQSSAAEARQTLQEFPHDDLKDVRWWVALINLSLREGDLKNAESLLADAERKIGRHVELKVIEAMLAAYAGDDNIARLAMIVRESREWPVEERVRLLYELSGLYVSLGRPEEAQELHEEIARLTPHDIRIWLRQFDAAMNRNDFKSCRSYVDAMRKIEGKEGSYTLLAEAFLMLRTELSTGEKSQRRDTARSTLTALQVRRPRWARVPWALALLDELDGRREHAAESYLRAFDLGDRSPDLVRRTLSLLHALHRYDLAEELIHRWEQIPNAPILPEINRMAAEISLEQQNPQQALLRAERAVSRNSANYQDHLWLAQIHRAGGDLAQAETALETAVRLAPLTGETWVALTNFLLRTERDEDASAVINRVLEDVPVANRPSILAACYEVLNMTAEAEREYLQAVSSAPDDLTLLHDAAEFFRRQKKLVEAERLWRQLLGLCANRPTLERCTARRGLAATLAFKGDYPAFREALALVEQNLAELPRNTLDLRAKSTLLAMRGDPQQRKESADLFVKLAHEEPLTSQDQSLLAMLYELNGDLTQAHKVWQVLVAAQSQNPKYLARYISVLLKRNAKSDALIWLGRLQEVAPDSHEAAELEAEYWLQEGEVGQAIDRFRRQIEAAPNDETRSKRIVEAAETLERLSRIYLRESSADQQTLLAAAGEFFRRYVEQLPDRRHVLAGFLARTGHTDEALDLFDEAWEHAPAPIVSSVIAASLPMSNPGPEQLSRVTESVQRHLPQPPPVAMLNHLAVLKEMQQDFDQAEAHYREVLALDPKNIVAHNNLAFLLALQNRKLGEATQLIEQAIALAGPSAALLDTRAQVAVAAGKLDEARLDREAVTREMPSAVSWFRLAIVYHQQHDDRRMREAVLKSRKFGLNPGELHFLERRFLDTINQAVDAMT